LAAGEFFQGDPDAISGQHVIFEQGSGNLYYDADGVAGGAQLFATVGHGSDVHNSDIHVV
jgi:Ca2+-binding RTX toxin-like protein